MLARQERTLLPSEPIFGRRGQPDFPQAQGYQDALRASLKKAPPPRKLLSYVVL